MTRKKSGWVTSQPFFASGKKNRIRVKYFSSQVGLGQKILTCIVMSTNGDKVHGGGGKKVIMWILRVQVVISSLRFIKIIINSSNDK